MSVQSRELPTNARKQSALLRRTHLVQVRHKVERVLAVLVWCLSTLGTIVALHGGWGPVLALQISAGAIVGGFVIQGILTWIQWAYGDHKGNLLYLSSLGVDLAYTIRGYGPVIAPWLALWLASQGAPQPLLIGWLIVALVSFLMAWYPESRLVE